VMSAVTGAPTRNVDKNAVLCQTGRNREKRAVVTEPSVWERRLLDGVATQARHWKRKTCGTEENRDINYLEPQKIKKRQYGQHEIRAASRDSAGVSRLRNGGNVTVQQGSPETAPWTQTVSLKHRGKKEVEGSGW